MKASPLLLASLALACFSLPACDKMHAGEKEESHEEHHSKIVVTSPMLKSVTLTEQYVCLIRSRAFTEVKAMVEGYLEPVPVREGQAVHKGDVLFKIVPTLYQASLDSELAEARQARIEYDNAMKLYNEKVVSDVEVALHKARLDRAESRAAKAKTELDWCVIRAQFSGIIDRLEKQQGTMVKKEDVLTTLSDNAVMWVYFNVPEARHLEYQARQKSQKGQKGQKDVSQLRLNDSKIELILADGSTFAQQAANVTVEGKFNPETGNIQFRADFPNPDMVLRHGQTGNVFIHRTVKNALVIPQRATYEILDKQYVYVIDKDETVRQREIHVGHEMDDIYVIKSGLEATDKIVLEGVRQVRDGQKVEAAEFRKPEDALSNLKTPAE